MPRQFVKGDPRINRKGRPKKEFTITDKIRQIIQEKDPQLKKTYLEIFANTVIKRAIKGDPTCVKLVMQYIDGMPTQRIEINDKLEEAIEAFRNIK